MNVERDSRSDQVHVYEIRDMFLMFNPNVFFSQDFSVKSLQKYSLMNNSTRISLHVSIHIHVVKNMSLSDICVTRYQRVYEKMNDCRSKGNPFLDVKVLSMFP